MKNFIQVTDENNVNHLISINSIVDIYNYSSDNRVKITLNLISSVILGKREGYYFQEDKYQYKSMVVYGTISDIQLLIENAQKPNKKRK